MFQRILVAYDGSESAREALGLAIDLARARATGLTSLSIEEPLPRYAATISEVEGARERIEGHFRALTKEARDRAALEGVELDAVVRKGHEVREILDFVREGRFDLLVLGAHGHSRVLEWVAGSTSLAVARLSPCSVLIARASGARTGPARIERILVGIDGSPLGRLAFRAALDLAILFGARVVGATVREVSPLARPEALEVAYVQQLQAAAEEHARAAGVVFEPVGLGGHAARALREQARTMGADLLVLGATGLEHPWSPTIGGTAGSVAAEAPCSVLLVRPPQAILHVRDVMTRAVSSVAPDTPLAEVVDLLLRRDVKALPVVDSERRPVGMITGGDLLARGGLELRLSLERELDADTLRERLQALARGGRAARDVMARHVRTVPADADLSTAIRLMTAHRVKRLPVVDRERRLAGIVSRADVLRAIAALSQTAASPARLGLSPLARTVADAAITEAPVVSPDASAEHVLERVLASPWRRAVVTDAEGKALGIVSDRDILARAGADARPWLARTLRRRRAGASRQSPAAPGGRLTASALMAPALITVRPGDSLAHAIRLMMQHRVKRLVVVDEDGRFRGLVDRREILKLLTAEPGAAADQA